MFLRDGICGLTVGGCLVALLGALVDRFSSAFLLVAEFLGGAEDSVTRVADHDVDATEIGDGVAARRCNS